MLLFTTPFLRHHITKNKDSSHLSDVLKTFFQSDMFIIMYDEQHIVWEPSPFSTICKPKFDLK